MNEYKVTSMINQSEYKLSDISSITTGRVLWLKYRPDHEDNCFFNQEEVDSLLDYLNNKTQNFGGHKTELVTDEDKLLVNQDLTDRAIKLPKGDKEYYIADLLELGNIYPFDFKLIGIHDLINPLK